ncbi:MAG: cyclic nucleotide-binding domain-containing protein [Anaerolineae bacterium]|nr:cyclic nucleotide-binding domain-containing protein [Anaerolineae bacterium]MDH7472524.1 cyclic nucleotide-binding domain-containing protein [Anaerolineae bacterium]
MWESGLWSELDARSARLSARETALWRELDAKANQQPVATSRLRDELQQKGDPIHFCPQVRSEVIIRRLQTHNSRYYVLKNPQAYTYLRLADHEFFLWRLMDGTRSLNALMTAYFQKYRALAISLVSSLVDGLRDQQFLTARPIKVYEQVQKALAQRRPSRWSDRAIRWFTGQEFSIRGLDRIVSTVYRAGGWLLFTAPVLVVFILIALLGLLSFFLTLRQGTFSLLKSGDSLTLGLILLWLASLLTIFLHECAHALTTKHFGREVHRGGFMFYYGLPAFFVDTMDIWMEDKGPRMAVSAAGTASDLIIGGLCSLLAYLFPQWTLSAFLYKIAFTAYLGALFNLNPLLELDGYFLLMDWLEIPMLRQRSLTFVRTELGRKIRAWLQNRGLLPAQSGSQTPAAAPFSREERIFTVFGLLSAVYTVIAVWLALYFWQKQLSRVVSELWMRGGLGRMLIIVLGGALIAGSSWVLGSQLARLLGSLSHWLVRQRILEHDRLLAGLLLGLLTIILGLALFLPADWRWAYLLTTTFLLTMTALSMALVATRYYAGSAFQGVFVTLSIALFLLLPVHGLRALGVWYVVDPPWPAVIMVLSKLALLSIPIMATLAFRCNGPALTTPGEKAIMAFLFVLSLLAVLPAFLWITRNPTLAPGTLLGLVAPYSAILGLALLIPTQFAFSDSHFGLGWNCLLVAIAYLVAEDLLRVYAQTYPQFYGVVYGLGALAGGGLAVGCTLIYLAHLRAAYRREEWPLVEALSDQERLRDAFAHFYTTLFAQFREVYGWRLAQIIDDRLDVMAVTANWGVMVDRGQIRDVLPLDSLTLADQASRYEEVLNYTIGMMDDSAGRYFLQRAIQNAYDGLPWQEREVLGHHLLQRTPWGATLSQDFESTAGDYRYLLCTMPLFADAADADIEALVAALRTLRVKAGRTFAHQGQSGDRFFLVRFGEVEVWQRDEKGEERLIAELHRGDYFGEHALLHEEPYPATYRAAVDSELLVLAQADFNRLVKKRFQLSTQVQQAAEIVALLNQMPIFSGLTHTQIRQLARQFRRRQVQPDEVLITQGVRQDTFYVISQGTLVVIGERGSPQERILARLGVGEFCGEIGLLLDQPPIATVVGGAEGATVLALDHHHFNLFVRSNLGVSHRLEQVSSRRVIDTRRKLGLSGMV